MSDKVKRTASRDSSSILTQLSTISRETSNQPLNSSETQFPLGVSGSVPPRLSVSPSTIPHGLPGDNKSPTCLPAFHISCSGEWPGLRSSWHQNCLNRQGPCSPSPGLANCGSCSVRFSLRPRVLGAESRSAVDSDSPRFIPECADQRALCRR